MRLLLPAAISKKKIRQIQNYYLTNIDQQVAQINDLNMQKDSGIIFSALYLSENIDEHSLSIGATKQSLCGFSEEEGFQYFLKCVDLYFPSLRQLIVRPHPSQSLDSIQWIYAHKTNLDIQVENQKTLLRHIIENDIVVGFNSMAMVVSLHLGKKTVCAIPPWGEPCSLPFNDIVKLSSLTPNN